MEHEILNLLILVLGGLVSLTYVFSKQRWLNRQIVAEHGIENVAEKIRTGVRSFIRKQFSTAFAVIGIFFIFISWMVAKEFLNSWYTPFAVLSGAFFSALSAYFGLLAAVKANAVTAAFTKKGLNQAFRAALNGGSVMGFSVCGFGLLDLAFWYALIYFQHPDMPSYEMMEILTSTVITFAFGASFMAFMARVAGGIFTKSADSAADTVGKGEFGWEEDDVRNPATIADNVGDNVSDVAGMGQDLNESYVGGNVASMEAGFQAFHSYAAVFGVAIAASVLVMLPLAISTIGIIASMIGLYSIRAKDNSFKALLNAVRRGVYLTSVLIVLGSIPLIHYFFDNWNFVYAIIIGLVTGNALAFVSEYYTSSSYKPVLNLAKKAEGGHASIVVEGQALGMESVLSSALILVIGMVSAFYLVGYGDYNLGIYGVSLAAVAMLSTLPITLTIDAFGPIADNAQGLLEMNKIDGERARIGNNLDALGNTTAATGKGYAIGSAAFAAIALINALWHTIESAMTRFNLPFLEIDLSINNIWIMSGLLIGGAVPWLFSSYLLRAVGNTAFILIKEIKRQVRELGINRGENSPDYQKCVTISLAAAQKYSIVPAFLVIVIPFIVALIGGPAMLLSFLLSALFSAFCKAVYMNNAGGAWDNAKKMIEAGFLGGKNTDAHRAAITGDMIGDPYKDTAGPALNILIKLMVTFSILMAPLTMYLHYLWFA